MARVRSVPDREETLAGGAASAAYPPGLADGSPDDGTGDDRVPPRRVVRGAGQEGSPGASIRDSIDRENGDYRHWAQASQRYAPADVLFQYIRYGWQIDDAVFIETYYCLRSRSVNIYHFQLRREEERISVPVLANPAVRRLVRAVGSKLVHVDNEAPELHVRCHDLHRDGLSHGAASGSSSSSCLTFQMASYVKE